MARYQTLSVDTDAKSRNRLKQATSAVPTFGTFVQSTDLRDAHSHINSGQHFDVVFISDRVGLNDATDFIKKAKEQESTQDAAFIIIAATQDEMATMVARNMIGGADGFLCEPYSVDSLTEITELAAKVKKERSDAREKAAMNVLIREACAQITKIAQLRSHDLPTMRESKKLNQMCELFHSLDGDKLEMFYEVAFSHLENAKVPPPLVKEYKGASSRVQRRMEKKAIEKLMNETDSTPDKPASA
ncbi:MAG: hypothetical protein KDD42_07525 [Bdellovibrionales bacterium]|nr:hypothetical protein [Bdellovibrionales bacterium]